MGVADPPSDLANLYTSLSIVGYALKYLPTAHTSEPDVHEKAIGLQMATALQLLPHIRGNLSALTATNSTNEVHTKQSISKA